MVSYDLFDAFDDCVDRLNAGQSLEDCLQAHPQHAGSLLPLVKTAVLMRQASPAVPVGARARVRERVIRAAPRRTRGLAFAPPSLAFAAAAVLVVGFVLAMLLLTKRDMSPAVLTEPLVTDTPSATATLIPSPSVTATFSPTATPSPTATATQTATATLTLTPTPAACTFTVVPTSVNLHSGPGTGYGLVGHAFAGDRLTVIARHSSDEWLQLDANERDAWVDSSLGTLDGDCAGLPVSTVPLNLAPGSGRGESSDDDSDSRGPREAGDDDRDYDDDDEHDDD